MAARIDWQKHLDELALVEFEEVSPEEEQARARDEAAARAKRHARGHLYVLPVGAEYVKIGRILDPRRIPALKNVYWTRYELVIGEPWVSDPISHTKPEHGGDSDLQRLKDMLLAYADERSDQQRPTFTNDASGFRRNEFDLYHTDFEPIRDHAIELTTHADTYLARQGGDEIDTRVRRMTSSFERAFGPQGRFPSGLSPAEPATPESATPPPSSRGQQWSRIFKRWPFFTAKNK
ncbi:hypothetical protein [Nocardia noduli]|uniref:hypothetical protein n=1 Tax=Nocardia noduli TaxID=2815722 RepID=UPI001C2351C8|nr:hypothetical protein [Nocardia noduli]